MKTRILNVLLAGFAVFGLLGSPVIALAAGIGGSCTSNASCNTDDCGSAGSGCFCSGLIAGPTGTCQARGASGATCVEDAQCVTGTTCNIVSHICESPHDQAPIANCWCKIANGTCENHALNDGAPGHKLALQCSTGSGSALRGSSAADTQACDSYCSFRGFRAVHCETGYHDYYTSDSTADEANRCLPRSGGTAPTTPGYTPSGHLGDGGEGRTSPADFGFVNPLGTSDLSVVISRIIRAALGIVGAVFLAMFVYGGLLWMTSGDSKRIEQARSTLINAVIGMAIVAFSYSMVTIVFNLANQVSTGS